METEVPVSVVWDSVKLDVSLRADLLVDSTVIVEVKSVEEVAPVRKKQLLTYLRLAEKPVGLLLNFGAPLMKDGVFRVVNCLQE